MSGFAVLELRVAGRVMSLQVMGCATCSATITSTVGCTVDTARRERWDWVTDDELKINGWRCGNCRGAWKRKRKEPA